MTNKSTPNPIPIRKEGWQQFLTNKLAMLSKYREAKMKSGGRGIMVEHGNVAEAEFRKWLQTFLPKRFGITSGYILTQNHLDEDTLPHFDVIIYDQLNSPILWVDDNSDKTDNGKNKAIPVEFVYGVLEIKSKLTSKSLSDAFLKLNQLVPFLEEVDNPNDKYKRFLPKEFFSCLVFFEIQKSEEYNRKILDSLTYLHRGFYGVIILSVEGKDDKITGKTNLIQRVKPIESAMGKEKESIFDGYPISKSIKIENIYLSTFIQWSDVNFSIFAFDILALISGTFENGRVSSFHGTGIGIQLPIK